MLDLLKRIVIFGIGIYIIMFLGRLFFNDFSFSAFTGDLKGAAEDIRSIGQIGRNSSSSINYGSNYYTSDSPTSVLTTSKGSESAVTLRSISRGNIVAPGQIIDGTAPGSWFYEGVSTVRFYDERGTLLGTSQMRAQADPTKGGQVPFTAVAQFTQGYAETGYVVFEKANVTGQSKNDAHFSFPITYPVRNSGTNINSNSNTGITFTQMQISTTSNTVNTNTSNSNTLAAPVVNGR